MKQSSSVLVGCLVQDFPKRITVCFLIIFSRNIKLKNMNILAEFKVEGSAGVDLT
jgi:hypothetical protein